MKYPRAIAILRIMPMNCVYEYDGLKWHAIVPENIF